ncbi:hypothetical protein Tco_0177278 [Tanacetum coccineum]
MHLSWASVFILLAGIIHDIEQLMCGFLWYQRDMKRGKAKAKVSWEGVCLPKQEGGLGIRKLGTFNVALMATHIWKLITYKESMWVRWIHAYKIKNISFWDVRLMANMSWGWRKRLQIREQSYVYNAGYSRNAKVKYILSLDGWTWPMASYDVLPVLNQLTVSINLL